ncbi:hypothetical protein TELCIR_15514, partial [Teladorsagia circumcincta]
VVFCDEKKFNCYGPEGNRYYWHDLRKEAPLSKQQFQRGRCYGLSCNHINTAPEIVLCSGKMNSKLCFVPREMNSSGYKNLLRHGLPFWRENQVSVFLFMQDNAPIHVSQSTLMWFSRHHVPLLPWPANSPDLNPMENVWGFMIRRIYANSAQFHTVRELKTALIEVWYNGNEDFIGNLYKRLDNRIFEVIRRNIGPIDY